VSKTRVPERCAWSLTSPPPLPPRPTCVNHAEAMSFLHTQTDSHACTPLVVAHRLRDALMPRVGSHFFSLDFFSILVYVTNNYVTALRGTIHPLFHAMTRGRVQPAYHGKRATFSLCVIPSSVHACLHACIYPCMHACTTCGVTTQIPTMIPMRIRYFFPTSHALPPPHPHPH
jgi:hypothetical protein